jgi:hypothetical protein
MLSNVTDTQKIIINCHNFLENLVNEKDRRQVVTERSRKACGIATLRAQPKKRSGAGSKGENSINKCRAAETLDCKGISESFYPAPLPFWSKNSSR